MLLTLILFIGYGILAGAAKALLVGSPKKLSVLQKCFGVVFVAFAIKLVLET
jgi:threonine/homoserine/homoserine lactone efflux protein